ncbi:unnamed protein product [Clonostachys solani]|uniref:CHAT domain-containing protein n=1 Tax=Clonostachys solani TaxID=160281 RepID=A0A9N9ZFZ0_9HYPO|nr:unnamed protein product [Clonostachys solani]
MAENTDSFESLPDGGLQIESIKFESDGPGRDDGGNSSSSRPPFLRITIQTGPLQRLALETTSHNQGPIKFTVGSFIGGLADAEGPSGGPYETQETSRDPEEARFTNLCRHEGEDGRTTLRFTHSWPLPDHDNDRRSIDDAPADASAWLEAPEGAPEIRLGIYTKAKTSRSGSDDGIFFMDAKLYYDPDKGVSLMHFDIKELSAPYFRVAQPEYQLCFEGRQGLGFDIAQLPEGLDPGSVQTNKTNQVNSLTYNIWVHLSKQLQFALSQTTAHAKSALRLVSHEPDASSSEPSSSAARMQSIGGPRINNTTEAKFDSNSSHGRGHEIQEACHVISNMSSFANDDRHSQASELNLRFQESGSMDDLHQSIELSSLVLQHSDIKDPKYGLYLNLYAGSLNTRHAWTGSISDLMTGGTLMAKYLDSCYERVVKGAVPFYNHSCIVLSDCQISYYKAFQTQDLKPLDTAILFAELAIRKTPEGDSSLSNSLSKLASALVMRYKVTGKADDLTRAVEEAEKSVKISPAPFELSVLAEARGLRFEQDHQEKGLDQAIDEMGKALKLTGDDGVNRGSILADLADLHGRRFETKGASQDFDTRISLLMEGCECLSWTPIDRIQSARIAGHMCAEAGQWKRASDCLNKASELFPLLSSHAVLEKDTQRLLPTIRGLASYTAAAALNAGMDAATVLPLLEMGRGALNNRLMDIRSDLTDLFEDHPDLAGSFVELRQKLNQTPATDLTEAKTSSRWRFRTNQEMKELLDTIRQQDKYHRFNLPQTAEEITSTASKGPLIVVNSSTWRCDAFLVDENKGIRLKELPDLTVAEMDRRFGNGIQSLKDPETLAWLWRCLCLPCLETLGFDKPLDSNWRRVWWIPTNGLDRVPLHAAGIFEAGRRDSVLDRVVSSYASSIRALQYARRALPMQPSNDPVSKNAVLVSVPVADPEGKTYRPLGNVVSEMTIVKSGCRKLSLDVIELEPEPKKADVLAQLPQCKLLHFSGHGDSKPDPSQSLLVLQDWATNSLTVSDVRRTFHDSSSPFLAFLSACSSGQNKGKDLADESLHMISAMQLAGFRHVIGTLWGIFDQPCVEVADTFYATLHNCGGLTHDAVALGLHLAVRKLRDGKGDGPEKGRPKVFVDGQLVENSPRVAVSQLLSTAWLPYVHFGP